MNNELDKKIKLGKDAEFLWPIKVLTENEFKEMFPDIDYDDFDPVYMIGIKK